MVYRKLKMMAVALAAAFVFVGVNGDFVSGQQYSGYGGSACSNCSNQIAFPSSSVVVSSVQSLPISQPLSTQYYPMSQPITVAQPLPTTSSFVASTANDAIISGQIVNNTYSSWPASNVVSGPVTGTFASAAATGQSVSQATGTFTSMPRPVVMSPTPVRSTLSAGYRVVGNSVGTVTSGLAQLKADRAASGGIRGHVGGSLGNARYEGVGWSNQSPQAAIEQCCYWGTRPVSEIGVRRGADGCWYACVLYQ